MTKKRGQITLFMIIAVVLVIALLLVLAFRYRTTLAQYVPESLFPTQTGTIEQFIEDCTDIVAREGLSILTAQGGYIYLPDEVLYQPRASIDQGLKVPLWHYFRDNRIPTEAAMESQMSRYVNGELKPCLANLDVFKNEFTIVEKGELSTRTIIGDQKVSIEVTYPLDIIDKEGKKITEISTFVVDVSVLLREMRDVGASVMDREAAELKFERLTIDLLSLDEDIPTAGTDISCTKRTWSKIEVENKLKTLLRRNLPSLRVDHTDFIEIPDDQPYMQNHYVWEAFDRNYDDISVGFTFVEDPFFMEVQPRSGNTLKSNQLKGQDLGSFVCLQQWNFVYDVEYPVLVTVADKKNGFALNYGFLVHVNDNRGKREPAARGPSDILVEGSEERYCENTYGGYNMRFLTFDNVTNPLNGEQYPPEAINDVDLSFTCLKYTCTLGQTDFIDGGANAVLGTVMPYCVNGILRGTKEGFKPAQKFIRVRSGEESIYLTPLKVFKDYTVVKHVDSNGVALGARPLDNDETAFISMKYRFNRTIKHETSGVYPTATDIDPQPIEMLAGATYPIDIEIYVMKDETIVGGYSGVWTPDWTDFKESMKLEFHVVTNNGATSDAQIVAFIAKLAEYSKDES